MSKIEKLRNKNINKKKEIWNYIQRERADKLKMVMPEVINSGGITR